MSADVNGGEKKEKSGEGNNNNDEEDEEEDEEEEEKTTTDLDFQRRNVGDLTSRELEKKYDHFYVVAQSIAIRVGVMDLTEQKIKKEMETETRRPSFVSMFVPPSALKKGSGSGDSSVTSSSVAVDIDLSAKLDLGAQLFAAKGRSLSHSMATYSMCSNEMFATIDMRLFLLSYLTLMDPSRLAELNMLTPMFTESPKLHFGRLMEK